MSYYIDVGEQDQALADQITRDKETLAAMHQTVADTRVRTNLLRQETAAQKRALDKSLLELKETEEGARQAPDAPSRRPLRRRRPVTPAVKRSRANAAAIIRRAAADQRRLAKEINSLIARQVSRGNIPSKFNGTMRWPMDDFNVSGNYGCSSYPYYAPGNGCAHYHNGIDLVGALTARRVKAAAGTGTVVYVGWNWADGADPAWVVVIAHSGIAQDLVRAHAAQASGVRSARRVKKGTVIGYEGSTGNSTGAHLHWMVEFNGDVREPAPVPVTGRPSRGRTFTQP